MTTSQGIDARIMLPLDEQRGGPAHERAPPAKCQATCFLAHRVLIYILARLGVRSLSISEEEGQASSDSGRE